MRIFRPLISAAAAATVTMAAATTGLASGGYKIEFSFNCNNPSVCFAFAGALGGDWGSIQLNADGTGGAEFTSAVHSTAGQPTGAVHFALVLTWSTFSSATPPAAAVAPDPNGNYLMITVVKLQRRQAGSTGPGLHDQRWLELAAVRSMMAAWPYVGCAASIG
jgi:hypothetical protein